jgi:hypothetical protein
VDREARGRVTPSWETNSQVDAGTFHGGKSTTWKGGSHEVGPAYLPVIDEKGKLVGIVT